MCIAFSNLYLTDDSNVALFPDSLTGEFNSSDMLYGGHFEVHGSTGSTGMETPEVTQAVQSLFQTPPQTPMHVSKFSFMKKATPGPSTQPIARRQKIYMRKTISASSVDGVSEKLVEIDDNVTLLLEKTKQLEDISSAISGIYTQVESRKKYAVPRGKVEAVRSALTCIICKEFLKEPMFSTCCNSLVGCKVCVNEWLLGADNCHKCRAPKLQDHIYTVSGLDDMLSILSAI